MKHCLTILFTFLVIFATSVSAQEKRIYFSASYNVITNPEQAEFYRVFNKAEGEYFRFTEYHKDGTWVDCLAKGSIENPVYVGDMTFYYKNGTAAIKRQYKKGMLITASGFYTNGILMYVNNYVTTPQYYMKQLVAYDADSLGRPHITNGNGIRQETDTLKAIGLAEHFTMEGPYKNGLKDGLWKGSNDKGFVFEEQYEQGVLTRGITKIETKKYHYIKVFEYPFAKGEMDKLEKTVMTSLTNPADTAKFKLDRRRFLVMSFTINADGSITDLRGFDKNTHAQISIDLKTRLPQYQPTTLRGVPVNYTVKNNGDFIFHNMVSPFKTDIYINGTYTRN